MQDSSGVAVPASAVTVTYDGPVCDSGRDSVVFRFKQTVSAGGSTVTPVAKLPADSKALWPAMVQVSGWIDTKGELQGATSTHGPAELAAAALAVAAEVRRPSAQINGVPVYQQAAIGIAVVGDGEPTAPVPVNPGPSLDAAVSSTVNGRIPVRSTYDWPGVTLANSQCAISADKSYGTTPDHPIRVGGGDLGGPARELAYMNVLRGGSGQGTRFRRLGSSRNAEGTILDIYELTFDGLPKPVLLYVDEYTFEDPKAPYGLVCLLPIPLTKDSGTTVVK